jgi:hypothetical protein
MRTVDIEFGEESKSLLEILELFALIRRQWRILCLKYFEPERHCELNLEPTGMVHPWSVRRSKLVVWLHHLEECRWLNKVNRRSTKMWNQRTFWLGCGAVSCDFPEYSIFRDYDPLENDFPVSKV